MIDIHNHLLPNLDDGAQNFEESVQLAQKLVEEGVTHAIVTPHHMNGRYVNPAANINERTIQFQEYLEQAQVPLQVFPGQEVRIHSHLVETIREGDIQFLDENNRYLLLEFPTAEVPAYTEDLVYDLKLLGITPIIAHPERNHAIQKDPDILLDLINQGCLSQITAASLAGVFGSDIQTQSLEMLDHHLAHLVASDMHDLDFRRAYLKEAFSFLEEEMGQERMIQIQNCAECIVNGKKVETPLPETIRKKKKRRWFGLF